MPHVALLLALLLPPPHPAQDPPVTIASLTHRWVPIDYREGVFQGTRIPGMAMLSDALEVSYDKGSYRQNKVRLVAEVDSAGRDGRVVTHSAALEKDVVAPSGKLWVAWAVSGRALEGRATMRVYLTENRKNGKTISNVITLPAAAGKTAQSQLEAELGPRWLNQSGPMDARTSTDCLAPCSTVR